jgi:hypothetical protein
VLGKVLNVAVVGHHPLAVLKRMAVQHRDITVGGPPDVRQHRLRGDNAADTMEEHVVERCRRASRDVRRAVDVESHTPAIPVVVALRPKRIVGVHQRPMNLALNHAAEPK